MRYFKRDWPEDRGDTYAHWGCSVWYFEVASDGQVTRQIEAYQQGPVLRYDTHRPEDEYGFLATSFDMDDMAAYEVSKEDFELAWSKPTVPN